MDEQPNEKIIGEENKVEKVKPKAVYIDDDGGTIDYLKYEFESDPSIVFSRCFNVKQALEAFINAGLPSIVLTDHALTSGGSEGLEIIAEIKKIAPETIFYTTTGNEGAAKKYQENGIEAIDKVDVLKIKSILENFKENKKE